MSSNDFRNKFDKFYSDPFNKHDIANCVSSRCYILANHSFCDNHQFLILDGDKILFIRRVVIFN